MMFGLICSMRVARASANSCAAAPVVLDAMVEVMVIEYASLLFELLVVTVLSSSSDSSSATSPTVLSLSSALLSLPASLLFAPVLFSSLFELASSSSSPLLPLALLRLADEVPACSQSAVSSMLSSDAFSCDLAGVMLVAVAANAMSSSPSDWNSWSSALSMSRPHLSIDVSEVSS